MVVLTTLTLKFTATAIHALAQISSLARLVYRSQRTRLYSDDACACLAMSFSLAWLACIWTPNLVDITTTEYVSYTQSIKALTYGMDSALVLAVIWLSRISLFLASTRILPVGFLHRSLPFSGLLLFIAMDTSSEIGPSHKCDSTGRASIVTEITFKFLSDIVIFAVPIIGFLSCSRNRHQAPDRVSLTLTSCAAATITATSIVHAIFLILGLEHLSDLTTAIESGVSLMAVNIAATVGVGL
ncbi:hypothetical protein EDD18DRAFT_1362083 [Armillaria luteobubalina]|uniref:Uncharacterized protein n=1 Tax=Armillaria luteobubalina TaxID=153913 RepID=A0AA39PF53_9AGAR|nr:hypothetical protein EDD18DRAFT_1362083 [Armillaria luteobubalina]